MSRSGCPVAALFIFLSSSIALAPAATTAPALQEFASQQFRLRFKYPADWTTPEPPPANQIFSATTPTQDKNQFGLITLRIDRATQEASDGQILIDVADTLASYIFKNGGQHVKIKPDQLGTLPARRITFQNDSEKGPIESVYIVAIKDRVEYVFNFAAPMQLFDSLLPAVNDLLNSFELLD